MPKKVPPKEEIGQFLFCIIDASICTRRQIQCLLYVEIVLSLIYQHLTEYCTVCDVHFAICIVYVLYIAVWVAKY